jgi:hypothetical protein
MAACTLDKVWPVLPGQADRHGVLVHGAVRGDGDGGVATVAEYLEHGAPTSGATTT